MPKASVLKRGQVQNLSCVFYYHANKTNSYKKGLALGLVLRVRVFGTQKWPIRSVLLIFFGEDKKSKKPKQNESFSCLTRRLTKSRRTFI